jgi:hypothetical protein
MLFAVFQPPCPKPNYAGITRLLLVTAFDEHLHSLITLLFAYFTFMCFTVDFEFNDGLMYRSQKLL